MAVVALVYLHYRRMRRLKAEDARESRHLDFGMDDAVPSQKKGKRKSFMFGAEKNIHRPNQLSMDMNLSSPYLLPPGVQGSRDSINSLARTFPSDQDPYRNVIGYGNGDNASMRSFGTKTDSATLYNKRASVMTGRSNTTLKMPLRQGSFPKSPMSPSELADPFKTPTSPAPGMHHPGLTVDEKANLPSPLKPDFMDVGVASSHDEFDTSVPNQPSPPPTALARNAEDRLPSPPADGSRLSFPRIESIGVATSGADRQELDLGFPKPLSPSDMDSAPLEKTVEPATARIMSTGSSIYGMTGIQPEIHTTPYPEEEDEEDLKRGRQPSRNMPEAEEVAAQTQGLSVPQQSNKRLSVGFRPLPPDDALESEDPEYRANRIRSFYKEYFEGPDENAPPLPSAPQGHGQAAPRPAGPQYYEDYDESYGDQAYYDTENNAFVMPYAQPVTRRAMTPPPAGRFREGGPGPRPGSRGGPRGPPRGHPGSMGGMSMPGGPMGRPRAGSAFGPRPGSSASGQWRKQAPKKNLPPPSALNTLPTPSKLTEDAFTINPIDFAPPDSFQERASGRSQSPLGERRDFAPRIGAASPLVSTFDELASLPSP